MTPQTAVFLVGMGVAFVATTRVAWGVWGIYSEASGAAKRGYPL